VVVGVGGGTVSYVTERYFERNITRATEINTLGTANADLRFYITTVQDE